MILIPFGLKDGRMVDIHQVDKGNACGCLCPRCKSPLIARKGDKNTHHFAHQPGAVCQDAYETALHKMAKQILMDEKRLKLPELEITEKSQNKVGFEHTETGRVCDPQWVEFDEVKEEVTMGNIRADIVGYFKQSPMIVEITVTHAEFRSKRAIPAREVSPNRSTNNSHFSL